MPNYDYKCIECGLIEEHVVKYENRDLPIGCSECDDLSMQRFYGKMPGLTKASFIDGLKRPGWEDLKATTKLEQAKAETKWGSDDREQVCKELNEREKKI